MTTRAKKKIGFFGWVGRGVLILFGLAIVANILNPNKKVDPVVSVESTQPQPTQPKAQPVQLEQKPTQEGALKMGQSANIGVWQITLTKITGFDSLGSDFMQTQPSSGMVFLVANVTMKNSSKKTQTYSTFIDQWHTADTKGNIYDTSTIAQMSMDPSTMLDGQISPGRQRNGKVVFEFPKNQFGTVYIEFFGSQRAEWGFKLSK